MEERPVEASVPHGHVPVLLDAVCEAMARRPDGVVVDATFGGGGYTRGLLRAGRQRIVAVDRDPAAHARALALAAAEPRVVPVLGRFGELSHLLGDIGIEAVDGIVADLGISSYQLDDRERGFAFQDDGPLDMRMGGSGASATDLLREIDPGALVRIIRDFGDEPHARRIARAIVARRSRAPITRTGELRELVHAAIGGKRGPRDPATRTFQAIRIAVNEELEELEHLLEAAPGILAPDGCLAIVSFHSGEDRIVKRAIDRQAGRIPSLGRHVPAEQAHPAPTMRWVTRRVVVPGPEEIRRNPRARSARLRVAQRLPDEDIAAGWGIAA